MSLLTPPALLVSAPGAEARRDREYRYREWRGRDGRTYCRKSDGTTGLVVGAVGGALLGRTIDTSGDRAAGTLLGAAAGGLLGREIDRGGSNRRCR
ncbi:outer membrane lipoprotein SlyB [Sphingobium subterraneum]|uniref:17 kDa surface antigen n=2 Tax=Sphingobium subterraneum TaxID=627688 RepID=A0A841IXE2_9SPHN|nr:outer membrane lipoprotein SlyB [Sphingobium subterraneum]